jgi:autotransporter strand-loop-strand O-heptosyltransferase
MDSNKLVSIFVPTRKRPIILRNLIKNVLDKIKDASEIEFTFIVDTDDEQTKSIIKLLQFDKLYINGEKINYAKNLQYDKFVDMHFVITDRLGGYKDLNRRFNHSFNEYPVGKWIFVLGDDCEIETENWIDSVKKLDSLNKLCIAKTNDWNVILVPSEIPKVFGGICPTKFVDILYNEIATELQLYEESGIIVNHNRVNMGSTAEDRKKYEHELTKSPNWVNDTWVGSPPGYDTKKRDELIMKLKRHIENKNMNANNILYSQKLTTFFESLQLKDLNKKVSNTTNNIKVKDSMQATFINGPKLEISGNSNTEYTVEFIDTDTNSIVHSGIITTGCWTTANRRWFTKWKIKVYDAIDLVYEENYITTGKKVYVHLASESIGDTLAWFPYVEEFRKKHNCKMVCSTFHNYLFESKYPEIQFIKPGTTVYDLYAMYEIGIYEGENAEFRNKTDHKKIPLQQVATDVLGLEFKEIRPNINIRNLDSSKIPGKYVVIATESTAQCKLWNYPGGWQKVVDYLNNIGYKVVVVQKEKTDLKNVIHKVGNKNLEVAVDIINKAEFFIGISSGLSWIAWALQKKTILISGFTLPWYEFNENCYRIYNPHSCKGCWHEHVFDAGDWNWCPMKKNFECSSTILPEDVYVQIETIINELDVMYTVKSPNVPINLTRNSIGFKFGDKQFSDAESIFYEIFRNKTYNFGKCRINENDIVLDLGANIGIFTRYARACRAKKIYSFEPIRENYDLLVKNNNDLSSTTSTVITNNVGISDKFCTEKFHIDSNSGGHTILEVDINHTRTKEIRQIECYSLDYMFKNKIIPDKIDFMKIDTEGAEIKILNGISDANLLKIKKIAIEWHQFLFEDKKIVETIIQRFVNLGYHFYKDHTGSDLMILYFWKP